MSGIRVCYNCANLVSDKAKNPDGSPADYHCPECQLLGPPLELPTKEEYQRFAKARRGRNEIGRRVMRETGESFKKSMKNTFGLDLRYDLKSVGMLDGVVEVSLRLMEKYDDIGTREDWTVSMGAFLGEALRRVYGGTWFYDAIEDAWMLCLGKTKSGHTPKVWPVRQIEKRITQGMEKSLAYFVKQLHDATEQVGGPAEKGTRKRRKRK